MIASLQKPAPKSPACAWFAAVALGGAVARARSSSIADSDGETVNVAAAAGFFRALRFPASRTLARASTIAESSMMVIAGEDELDECELPPPQARNTAPKKASMKKPPTATAAHPAHPAHPLPLAYVNAAPQFGHFALMLWPRGYQVWPHRPHRLRGRLLKRGIRNKCRCRLMSIVHDTPRRIERVTNLPGR